MGEHRRDLERAHETKAGHVSRCQRRDVLALIDDAAARRLEKLAQQIKACRLARTVRADQGVHGAARDLEVDAAHGQKTGEILGEVLGFEDGLRAHRLAFPWPGLSLVPSPRRSLSRRLQANPYHRPAVATTAEASENHTKRRRKANR